MKRGLMPCHFLLLSGLIIFLLSCGGGGKKNVRENAKPSGESVFPDDPSLLFNGKDLEGWDITSFVAHGPVYVSDSSIVLSMGEGCTGITWTRDFPVMNYKVTLDAMRIEGTDFFCGMTFPVKDEFCSLIVGGWAGATVGLSSIDGHDASENETTRIMKLDNNKWYNICLSVEDNSIMVWIDNQLVIDFRKNGKKLSIRSEVDESKPFGIASWYTSARLRNIRVVTSPSRK
jgi:hypothetical protein